MYLPESHRRLSVYSWWLFLAEWVSEWCRPNDSFQLLLLLFSCLDSYSRGTRQFINFSPNFVNRSWSIFTIKFLSSLLFPARPADLTAGAARRKEEHTSSRTTMRMCAQYICNSHLAKKQLLVKICWHQCRSCLNKLNVCSVSSSLLSPLHSLLFLFCFRVYIFINFPPSAAQAWLTNLIPNFDCFREFDT